MKIDCVICGKNDLEKDTIGINKKLLGIDITNFYCMDCLAEYLGCTVEELLDKIEEFKEEGCTLFCKSKRKQSAFKSIKGCVYEKIGLR